MTQKKEPPAKKNIPSQKTTKDKNSISKTSESTDNLKTEQTNILNSSVIRIEELIKSIRKSQKRLLKRETQGETIQKKKIQKGKKGKLQKRLHKSIKQNITLQKQLISYQEKELQQLRKSIEEYSK